MSQASVQLQFHLAAISGRCQQVESYRNIRVGVRRVVLHLKRRQVIAWLAQTVGSKVTSTSIEPPAGTVR